MKKIIFIILTILLIFSISGCSQTTTEGPEPGYLVGDTAYDFTLTNLNEEDVTLSDLQGNVVFLNFWASWCPPCQAELPDFNNFYAENKSKDFTLLAVNVGETKEDIVKFLNENNYDIPVVMDTNGAIAKKYGVKGIPKTLILDKNGVIIGAKSGIMTYEEMENFMQKAK